MGVETFLRVLIFYIMLGSGFVFLPVLLLISLAIRVLAYIATCRDPEYGNLLSYTDVAADEDFVNTLPKSTIVTTLVLDGKKLALTEFQNIFKKNVLDATITAEEDNITGLSTTRQMKARYPQLQQFISTYWGTLIWKNELDFRLEEHIKERYVDQINLSDIHQELINKPYQKWRSPWEVVLYRINGNDQRQCVLGLKIHHTMADARSIIKCIVECLGKKPLKTAEPRKIEQTKIEKLLFIANFPINYVYYVGWVFWYATKFHNHPWKTMKVENSHDKFSENVPLVVRLSRRLNLSGVKQVAKRNDVLPSSVILSIICGAIGKYNLRGDELIFAATQPKENHPDVFANHSYLSCLRMPTAPSTPDRHRTAINRLKECDCNLKQLKQTQAFKYLNLLGFFFGNLIQPWRKFFGRNYYVPLAITNIAGELEGFSLGKLACAEFCMSVGPYSGCGSVTFCVLSYKETFQVAVTGKDVVFSEERAKQIADEIEKEFYVLQELSDTK